MFLNILIFPLIVGVIYIFVYPDSQLATSTSAIAQIWSGSCRLSCRHSEYSGFSALSGLIPGNSQDNKGLLVAQVNYQGSNSCVCASCPCALVENVLRTCRPATTLLTAAVQLISNLYCTILEALTGIYNYMETILTCRASCQRPQLLETKDSTSDNIYFGNKKVKDTIEAMKYKSTKSDSGTRSSKSIVFRDVSDTEINRRDVSTGIPTNKSVNNRGSDATLKQNREDEDTRSMVSVTSNSCPKCIKQGKVCIKNCPKAAKKNK